MSCKVTIASEQALGSLQLSHPPALWAVHPFMRFYTCSDVYWLPASTLPAVICAAAAHQFDTSSTPHRLECIVSGAHQH